MIKYVYHGSSRFSKEALPRLNVRQDGKGKVRWRKISFHATPYRYIALAYLAHTRKYFTHEGKRYYFGMGLSLYKPNKRIVIFGKKSLKYSLGKLYASGKPGYLYKFDKKDFLHAAGLGHLEVVSFKKIKPRAISRIKDPVGELLKEGVKFEFRDETK